jgi:hypothetical protein
LKAHYLYPKDIGVLIDLLHCILDEDELHPEYQRLLTRAEIAAGKHRQRFFIQEVKVIKARYESLFGQRSLAKKFADDLLSKAYISYQLFLLNSHLTEDIFDKEYSLRRALEVDARNPKAWSELSRVKEQLGDYQRAEQLANVSCRYSCWHNVDSLLALFGAYRKLEDRSNLCDIIKCRINSII